MYVCLCVYATCDNILASLACVHRLRAIITFGITLSVYSLFGSGVGGAEPKNESEEMEEFTEYVPKNSWTDFYEFLVGNESDSSEIVVVRMDTDLPVEAGAMKTDPSFSHVMANIISSGSSHESSEDESHEKSDFPVKKIPNN